MKDQTAGLVLLPVALFVLTAGILTFRLRPVGRTLNIFLLVFFVVGPIVLVLYEEWDVGATGLGLAGILLALMLTSGSHIRRQICFTLLCIMLAVCTGLFFCIGWVFRDGLFPGSLTASHGVGAVQNFLSRAWPVALGSVLLALLITGLNHWTKKKLNRSQEVAEQS